jgi:hypothetical protein
LKLDNSSFLPTINFELFNLIRPDTLIVILKVKLSTMYKGDNHIIAEINIIIQNFNLLKKTLTNYKITIINFI